MKTWNHEDLESLVTFTAAAVLPKQQTLEADICANSRSTVGKRFDYFLNATTPGFLHSKRKAIILMHMLVVPARISLCT